MDSIPLNSASISPAYTQEQITKNGSNPEQKANSIEKLEQKNTEIDINRVVRKRLSPEEYKTHIDMIGAMMERMGYQEQPESPTQKFYQSMESAVKEINNLAPSIQADEWDFSVNSDGDIVLKDAEQLTEEEQSIVVKTLTDFGVAEHAADYADDMIFIVEMERGEFGSSNNVGKYDITRDNFASIIDMKSLYEGSNDGDGSFHVGLQQFFDQLAAKSEPKYQVVYEKPTRINL